MSSPHRLLIVGGGLTGSTTAYLLRKMFAKDILAITVWEKSRGAGGRMNTYRSEINSLATVDLGAQYISLSSADYAQSHERFYQELLTAKVLAPFKGIIEGEREAKTKSGFSNFVAPSGINAVVKYFLNLSESNVFYSTHCSTVNCCEKRGQAGQMVWQVIDQHDNITEFDSVIVTIPVPQLLQLQGSIQAFLQNEIKSLQNVEYSSRFAVGYFFDHEAVINVPWTCKYATGNPNIAFVSVDSRKRCGTDPVDVGPSLLVHSTKSFCLQHWDTDESIIKTMLISHVKEIIPDLPVPIGSRCIRWRYSQVVRGVDGAPGCYVLSASPLLIACGDAFTHSNFDGSLKSAETVAKAFKLS